MDKTNLFGKLDYLPKEQYNDFYEKTQIDVDGRKKLLSEGKYEFMKMANDLVKFSKNIPFFCDLDIEDQKALLKGDVQMYMIYHTIHVVSLYDGVTLYYCLFVCALLLSWKTPFL